MIISTIIVQSAFCQTKRITWQGRFSSAGLIAPYRNILCRCRNNGWLKCLNSILQAEHLSTKDWVIVPDVRLRFQAECAIAWTQLSNLTNVLKTWTILGLQPTVLRIVPGTIGQSSSAFAKQV